jgi:hypothetical protein
MLTSRPNAVYRVPCPGGDLNEPSTVASAPEELAPWCLRRWQRRSPVLGLRICPGRILSNGPSSEDKGDRH